MRYYCDDGFVQNRNPVIRCLLGGRWEEPQITCTPGKGVSHSGRLQRSRSSVWTGLEGVRLQSRARQLPVNVCPMTGRQAKGFSLFQSTLGPRTCCL